MRNIKHLPEAVHSSLRSGIFLFDLTRVAEELILNSLDAGTSKVSVAIGVQTWSLGICHVKVVDNVQVSWCLAFPHSSQGCKCLYLGIMIIDKVQSRQIVLQSIQLADTDGSLTVPPSRLWVLHFKSWSYISNRAENVPSQLKS